MSFINQHRERFGVEPICQTLQVAPSTYYAALSRPPSARQLRDEELKAEITRVHKDNFDVYGVEKVWKQLRREDIEVGRDRVGRLMAELMRAELALDALEMAIWARRSVELKGLVHHSDRGVQVGFKGSSQQWPGGQSLGEQREILRVSSSGVSFEVVH